jgi:hypothetical protein
MKKNRSLLIMLALAACFVGVLIWNEQQVEGIDTSGPKPQGTERLQARLDSLGRSQYDESVYKAVKSDIGASQMAEVITELEMNTLLASLEDKAAAAMVLSFDEWLSNDCGSITSESKALVSLMKKQSTLVTSEELTNRITIYSNFKVFLANKGRVNQFLLGQYTESGAQSLKAKINSDLGRLGVSTCSAMSSKKNDWMNTISDFKKDHEAFIIFFEDQGAASNNTCEKYKPYKFYYDQLINSGKCQ